MEDHCQKVARMQLKDPTTPQYFEISEHTHHEVIGVFLRLFVPCCGVLIKKNSVLMFSHLKDVIITHKAVEGEISKLKGQENQLRQKFLFLQEDDNDNESDDDVTVDMNDAIGDMDDDTDNLI
eukprot:8361602-Ditylum_brightwellii.AAC.1